MNKIKLFLLNKQHISKKYISWLNDYEVVKYSNQKYIKHNYRNVRSFVLNIKNSNDSFLYGIKYNNIHIGNIKIGPIDYNNQNTQISYFIGDRSYWNKGIASEAIKQCVILCKNKYKLKKIMAYVVKENVGSKKALLKNGFIKEGNLKKYFNFENKRLDEFVFSKNL